jgi:hypothetical protein
MTKATMIKLERDAKMEAAITRCKKFHPKVRRIDANTVAVSGRCGQYTVKLAEPKAGLKLAECDCAAGRDGKLCYHIPAAMSAPVAAPAPKPTRAPIL